MPLWVHKEKAIAFRAIAFSYLIECFCNPY